MPGYHSGYFRNSIATPDVPPSSPGGATNGAGVDMNGWDGVVFEMAVGTIGNGGTLDFRVVESANANFSGAVNITDKDNSSLNASIAQQTNAVANVTIAIDVFRPTNRYLRSVVTPATNNANVSVIARRYRATGRTPLDLPTNSQYITIRAN